MERYKVFDYPHLAIVDPRTGRSLWKKEGWNQEKPFSAEHFAEMAMDFCSRHSFDKAPLPPSKKHAQAAANGNGERKRPFMSEEEQMQAAMAASLKPENSQENNESNKDDDDEYAMEDADDDGDDIECLGTRDEMVTSHTEKEEVQEVEEEKPPSFFETLLVTAVGDEPADGARIQLRMPDATRLVRKFQKSDSVKTIYAFVAVRMHKSLLLLMLLLFYSLDRVNCHSLTLLLAIPFQQNNEEAKGGKEFMLVAGYPPKNLEADIESTIDSCGLNGQAVAVRWKD